MQRTKGPPLREGRAFWILEGLPCAALVTHGGPIRSLCLSYIEETWVIFMSPFQSAERYACVYVVSVCTYPCAFSVCESDVPRKLYQVSINYQRGGVLSHSVFSLTHNLGLHMRQGHQSIIHSAIGAPCRSLYSTQFLL